jgi:WD40 repeat protein
MYATPSFGPRCSGAAWTFFRYRILTGSRLPVVITLLGLLAFLGLRASEGTDPEPCGRVLRGHTVWVHAVAFAPDGQTLASSGGLRHAGGEVKLWDVATGRARAHLGGHPGAVYALAFAPDGQTLATGGEDGTVTVWDIRTGQVQATFSGHPAAAYALAYAPDGRTLAAAGVPTLPPNTPARPARDAGRTRATGGGKWGEAVTLWDVATGRVRAVLPGYHPVAFAPDGRTLATVSEAGVMLWDVASGQARAVWPAPKDRAHGLGFAPFGLAFAPYDPVLAAGFPDGRVHLWDLGCQQVRQILHGHPDAVNGVAYAPDGRTLVTASQDRTIRWWDAATGVELARLQGHERAVTAVAFAPDGRTVASASYDKTVRLWDLPKSPGPPD